MFDLAYDDYWNWVKNSNIVTYILFRVLIVITIKKKQVCLALTGRVPLKVKYIDKIIDDFVEEENPIDVEDCLSPLEEKAGARYTSVYYILKVMLHFCCSCDKYRKYKLCPIKGCNAKTQKRLAAHM